MKEKLTKIAKPVTLLAGFFMLFIAPRISPTIPTWAYYIGVALIVGFVLWNSVSAYVEYYLKEKRKGKREQHKAIIAGVLILVFSFALFFAIRFSGLSAMIFKGYYGTITNP